MAARKIPEAENPGSFNMTPMIDVTFQLIIFFMLVSDISTKNTEPVILPFADMSVKLETRDEDELIVNLRANGDIVIGGKTYYYATNVDDEVRRIKSTIEFFKNRRAVQKYWLTPGGQNVKYPLLVRADRTTEWIHVQKILMIATGFGGVYNASLGAKKPE